MGFFNYGTLLHLDYSALIAIKGECFPTFVTAEAKQARLLKEYWLPEDQVDATKHKILDRLDNFVKVEDANPNDRRLHKTVYIPKITWLVMKGAPSLALSYVKTYLCDPV